MNRIIKWVNNLQYVVLIGQTNNFTPKLGEHEDKSCNLIGWLAMNVYLDSICYFIAIYKRDFSKAHDKVYSKYHNFFGFLLQLIWSKYLYFILFLQILIQCIALKYLVHHKLSPQFYQLPKSFYLILEAFIHQEFFIHLLNMTTW